MECLHRDCQEQVDPDEMFNHMCVDHRIYFKTAGTTTLFKMILSRLEQLEKKIQG